MKVILDDDSLMATTGVILSDWSSGTHTSEQALAALRATYARRNASPNFDRRRPH